MATNPAIEVQQYGQSLWLDYIHREELDTGELQRRIDEQGILGVTSNPSIFKRAIGASDVYDEAMRSMLDLDAEAVYEALAVDDIQRAADLFRPIYDDTDARDGYVSLEVSPLLASDTQATIDEAKRLAAEVDRPNLMVKIPATDAGIPAIEDTIAAGINVNVTLIFSVENYKEVVEAYLSGLEQRLDAGEDISRVASVASFFLSRIDVAVDRILENNMRIAQVHGDTGRIAANRRLLGQAAIANARLAYQAFQGLFDTRRFRKLSDAGAQVQRPLWASTSTKNAHYSDTRYVDNLIGKDTVNTVPPKTLAAFVDHGTADETLTAPLDSDNDDLMPPRDVMDKLAELNVDIEQVCHRLQVDGVESFAEDFQTMISQVRAKLAVLSTGIIARQKMALGIYADRIEKTLSRMEHKLVNARLWSKDGSLWKDHNSAIHQIEQRLGWLDVQDTIDRPRLQELQDATKASDTTHVVLMGMGGSSLAADVMYRIFGKHTDFPELIVLDSTNPARIHDVEDEIDLENTVFIVASKSGTTVETLSFFRHFFALTGENGDQFIAITDPDTPLADLANEHNFRDVFLNPADIGGRYSALSYFGMAPAAMMGLDLERLWDEADRMIRASHEDVTVQNHPGIHLGTFIGTLHEEGRNKLALHTTESFKAFGDWVEQLIAESLGKEGKGVLPVVGATVAKPISYASDRQFVYLRVDNDPDVDDMDTAIRTLREAGHPRATLRLKDKYSIAGEFFRWEYATAIAGYLMELNPFDEPNVAEAKQATRDMLTFYKAHGHLPPSEPLMNGEHTELYSDEHTVKPLRELCRAHGYDPDSRTEVLAAQFAGTHSGDYFALLAYFEPDEIAYRMLHDIRGRIRAVTKRAVTLGFGPRYLHSTGQLHKGGGNNGIFFLITMDDDTEDIALPGEKYSFGTLYRAQALGDMQVLRDHKRRVFRLHIKKGAMLTGLQKLIDAIEFVEQRRF